MGRGKRKGIALYKYLPDTINRYIEPFVGGVIGGGITYATFKPCCVKLVNTLKETRLANPKINDDDLEDIIDIKDNKKE